jgi:hypothetical protein
LEKWKHVDGFYVMLSPQRWALWELGQHSNLPHRAIIPINPTPPSFTLHVKTMYLVSNLKSRGLDQCWACIWF